MAQSPGSFNHATRGPCRDSFEEHATWLIREAGEVLFLVGCAILYLFGRALKGIDDEMKK